MNNNKEYGSLGEMVSSRDYKKLKEVLLDHEKNDQMHELTSLRKGENVSTINALLFNIPRFASKPVVKEKDASSEGCAILSKILKTREMLGGKEKEVELADGVLDVVDILLRNGANPNLPMSNGVTCTMLACTVNNKDLLNTLINNEYTYVSATDYQKKDQKADLGARDNKGLNLIYYAAMSGSLTTLNFLVKECGLDINYRSFLMKDKTVLHLLCQSFSDKVKVERDGFKYSQGHESKEEAIDAFIELGADPSLVDSSGSVPEELVPSFDECVDTAEDFSKEEIDLWDKVFTKVGNYRVSFEKKNKKQHKSSF